MNTAQSVLAKLCVEPGASPHTFDTNSEAYALIRESLKKPGHVMQSEGNRGTRSRSKHRRRNGAYFPAGMLALDLTPNMLANWLPRILGSVASGNVYSVADTLPSFGVLVNRVNTVSGGGHFQYSDCKVDRCLIVGRSGNGTPKSPDYVRMWLHLVSLEEVTGTAYPAVTLSTAANDAAYVFRDQTLTLQGAARRPKQWGLMINNFLMPRITYGSTPDAYFPSDRLIALSATFPWDDEHADLHDIGTSGAAGSLLLTNGNLSTNFAFGWLDCPADSPTVPGRRSEVGLRLQFLAAASDTADEIRVTNDSDASS